MQAGVYLWKQDRQQIIAAGCAQARQKAIFDKHVALSNLNITVRTCTACFARLRPPAVFLRHQFGGRDRMRLRISPLRTRATSPEMCNPGDQKGNEGKRCRGRTDILQHVVPSRPHR